MRDRGFESKRRVYPLSRNHDRESTNGFLSAVIEKGAFDRKAPKSEAMGPRSEARTEKTKKRKYSPIIWDRDERRQPDIGSKRSNMTGKVLSVNETLAPFAPQTELSDMLAISPRHSGTDDRENELGQIEEDEDFYVNETLAPLAPQTELSDMLVISPQHSGMDDGENELGQIEEDEDFHVNETLAPLAPQTELSDMLVISPQHSGMDDGDNELGQIEEDEDFYAVARTISSSRWADKDDLDIAAPEKKTNISPLEKNTIKKVQSRSCGSDRAQSRSSGSDRGEREEDCMVVDGGEGANRSDHSSVRGYESEFSREETPVQSNSNPPKRRINMLQGCRLVDEFDRLNKISEGTYGVVYRARDKKTGEVVALKKVKMEKEKDGFPLTSLREINILLSLNHPSIVDMKEVVMGSSLDSIFMVMEYMEHDLKGVMDTMKQPYSQSEVKCLILQLLEGVSYLHDNWILHRDLKTSNLLVDNCGNLKICDFGLARQYGSPLKPYTPLVVTLWYRAPELLLGAKEYSTAIDMWSVGCIMAELLSKEPLFDGRREKEQLSKIFSILGSPNENIWPGYKNLPGAKVAFPKQPYNRLREKFPATSFSGRPMLSVAGFDLLNKLLTYDPEKRISAEEALRHPWFSEVPLPKSKDFMPTFPAHNDRDRTVRQRVMKSPDPIEEHLKAANGREPWRIRLG